jgi:hypothetical protein
VDVFGVGTDQAVWHVFYDGGWFGPQSLHGVAIYAPSAVSWGGHRLDLIVTGTDGGLYTSTWLPPPGSAVALTTLDAAHMTGYTWHVGCPVGLGQLRELTVAFWGTDRAVHDGQLVLNADAVPAVAGAFASMLGARFPILAVGDAAEYAGQDETVATSDMTSAFNCRAVTGSNGPPSASMHSWGRAVDVNPLVNPYVKGSLVVPAAGVAYLDRTQAVPGMIRHGDAAWSAWSAVGWRWGGDWTQLKDYMHFSYNGQ